VILFFFENQIVKLIHMEKKNLSLKKNQN